MGAPRAMAGLAPDTQLARLNFITRGQVHRPRRMTPEATERRAYRIEGAVDRVRRLVVSWRQPHQLCRAVVAQAVLHQVLFAGLRYPRGRLLSGPKSPGTLSARLRDFQRPCM